MSKRNKYHISQEGALYTVIHWDKDGVATDLNAEGVPCTTKTDLVEFIYELERQGAYGEDVRHRLIEEVVA